VPSRNNNGGLRALREAYRAKARCNGACNCAFFRRWPADRAAHASRPMSASPTDGLPCAAGSLAATLSRFWPRDCWFDEPDPLSGLAAVLQLAAAAVLHLTMLPTRLCFRPTGNPARWRSATGL
jgi:hypothetical protein